VVPSLLARLAPALAAAALVLAAPSAALAADCPGADAAPASPQAPVATLCLLNAERAAQGLGPLSADVHLTAAASAFAADMVARQFFDHVSPDGGTMMDRLHAAGWHPAGAWSAGENIAWGSGDLATPALIVDAWMHSAGHRANILNGAFTQIGLGIAPGAPQADVRGLSGTYVTDFGAGGEAATTAPARPATAPATAPARPAATRKRPVARCARAARTSRGKRAARRCSARR
jgi:uncharacterized protein YkwD